MEVLIINGPNLNLQGKRETDIYGNQSFEVFLSNLPTKNFELSTFQSNLEGEIINQLQQSKADGIILNAGGYTHTSVAIRDAVSAIETPVVEVHISNISARESFRHESLISPVAVGCIFGFGWTGYRLGIDYITRYLNV